MIALRSESMDRLDMPLCEPVKRNHDGYRHHVHRFPIKGGITLREVMVAEFCETLSETNAILASMDFQ